MRFKVSAGRLSALMAICLCVNIHTPGRKSDFRGGEHDFSKYEGLSGIELARAVRNDFAPDATLSSGVSLSSLPQEVTLPQWPCAGSRVSLLMPEKWTGSAVYDLYNVVGGDDYFENVRMDYVPGTVEFIRYSGPGWMVGDTIIGTVAAGVWSPAADRRGDLARRFMYLALMYPKELWSGRAPMMLADGEWPLLTTYGRDLLGAWNESDPVDAREEEDMDAISRAQGNENPFIVFPALYDYLWGEKAGQAVVPEEKGERVPLKGTYSKSADRYIDLYSPYIEGDAEWKLDDVPTGPERVSLNDIGEGTHVLSYKTPTSRGKLKITVTP